MSFTARTRGFIVAALLPAAVLYSFFVIIPLVWSAYYGFFDWKGMGEAKWLGFDNYAEVIRDPLFWHSFKNNMIIVAASILGQVPIAFALALVLRKNSWFRKFVRTAVFMPMVLSSVVVGMIWGYVYHPQIGILNFVLEQLGLGAWEREWLSDPKIAMYSLSVPIIWNYIGPFLIMFIAALQNIPDEINDAAKMTEPARRGNCSRSPCRWCGTRSKSSSCCAYPEV